MCPDKTRTNSPSEHRQAHGESECCISRKNKRNLCSTLNKTATASHSRVVPARGAAEPLVQGGWVAPSCPRPGSAARWGAEFSPGCSCRLSVTCLKARALPAHEALTQVREKARPLFFRDVHTSTPLWGESRRPSWHLTGCHLCV